MRKTTKKLIPILIAAVTVLFMGAVTLPVLYAAGIMGREEIAIMVPILCYILIFGAVMAGVLLALFQRLREINGGEEEDASQY